MNLLEEISNKKNNVFGADESTIKPVDISLFKGDQLKVFNRVDELVQKHINQGIGGLVLIQGRAGTGKTWCVQSIIEHIVGEYGRSVAMLAPTGEAVKVCRDKASYTDRRVNYRTVHSAYNMRPVYKEDKIYFYPDKKKKSKPIDEDSVIFIDEASMLEDILFNLSVQDANKGKLIIFIGDEGQLAPINCSYAKPFVKEAQEQYNIEVIELLAPIRQLEGNPILDACEAVYYRREERTPIITMEDKENDNNEIILNIDSDETEDLEYLDDLVKDVFSSPKIFEDSNYAKLLCYTNKEVNKWNDIIRPIVFNKPFEELSKIEIGEKVLANGIYKLGQEVIFSTNAILTVLDKEEQVTTIKGEKYRYYATNVSYLDGRGIERTIICNILHEDSENDLKSNLDKIGKEARKETSEVARNKLWADFWKLKEEFLPISYNYAKTVHKSQGGTYQHVFVMVYNILTNWVVDLRNRMLYVGMSRAQKSLVLVH